MKRCKSSMQYDVLQKYVQVKGKQSLRVMSEETGIQITRLFRVINGDEMKIGEYELLNELILTNGIKNNVRENGALLELSLLCQKHLPSDLLDECIYFCESHLERCRQAQ